MLDRAREEWDEIRGLSCDHLMFVRGNTIIPHNYTFYDFAVDGTRGVGNQVLFGLTGDVFGEGGRGGVKVLEVKWFELNQHIYPASNWEVFDSLKDYGKREAEL